MAKEKKVKKKQTLHDFLIAKIRSASQKWPETYGIKDRVRVEVRIEYNKADPEYINIHVPETTCRLANGLEHVVKKQIIRRKVFKPAQNRDRVMYLCEHCKQLFFEKDLITYKGAVVEKIMIAADHIDPIVDPTTGFVDWNTYIDRSFPGDKGLQLLCNFPGDINGIVSCHRIKTNEEKAISAARERERKGLPPKQPKKARKSK